MKISMRGIISVLPVTAVILTVLQIVLANRLAGSGHAVRQVDISIDMLRKENAMLEQYVASASSLMTIAYKAREMGMIEPSKSDYITIGSTPLPVAFNNPR